jgi:hypothetical protein
MTSRWAAACSLMLTGTRLTCDIGDITSALRTNYACLQGTRYPAFNASYDCSQSVVKKQWGHYTVWYWPRFSSEHVSGIKGPFAFLNRYAFVKGHCHSGYDYIRLDWMLVHRFGVRPAVLRDDETDPLQFQNISIWACCCSWRRSWI